MKSTTSPGSNSVKSARPDLAKYESVVIQDFGSTYTDKRYNKEMMSQVGKKFANLIKSEVSATTAFKSASRIPADADLQAIAGEATMETILLGGTITKYDDGNAAARALIGLGAGSSYFEAVVTFTDLKTGEVLGKIDVDKTSWVLGGGLAAGQTAESFMPGAAKKVAKELELSKNGNK